MIHELKTWPEYFAAVIDGRKTFEVRKFDRPFLTGDVLYLREWEPLTKDYTGREACADVTYIYPMLAKDSVQYVVMAIRLKEVLGYETPVPVFPASDPGRV